MNDKDIKILSDSDFFDAYISSLLEAMDYAQTNFECAYKNAQAAISVKIDLDTIEEKGSPIYNDHNFAEKFFAACDNVGNDDNVFNLLLNSHIIDITFPSNIFKMSFLNCIVEFEATVSHILQNYFCENPNRIDEFFNTKGSNEVKFSVSEVAEFSEIKDLISEMVARQFEYKHLSDLLVLLKKFEPLSFDNDYEKIMEMISRRNTILHNSGIVNKKYYVSYNIFKLKVGDFIYIGVDYTIEAFKILCSFIHRLDFVLKNKT